MPRGRSMGFVLAGTGMRTYAHELGHGVFGLEHTFPDILKGSTNNLMDYGSGTHLTQKQWDIIEKNKFVWSWRDEEEDGALMSENLRLYDKNTGVFITERNNFIGKRIICVVDRSNSKYNPSSPFSGSEALRYQIGKESKNQAVEGIKLRSNHPLNPVNGGKGWQYNSYVYYEDMIDMSVEFDALLTQEKPIFSAYKVIFDEINFTLPMRESLRTTFWISLVNTNKPYDLKSQTRSNIATIPSYAGVFIGEYSIFNGRLMQYDDYGNFAYGYWGKSYGYSRSELVSGGTWAQFITTLSFDPPKDTFMIEIGFDHNK